MALSVNHLTGFGGGSPYGPPLSYTYLQTATDSTNGTTTTFSSQNLGTAASNRTIVVAVNINFSGAPGSITAMTVGGVSVTTSSAEFESTGFSGVFYASVPTGSTGDIVISSAATMSAVAISVYALYGDLISYGGYESADIVLASESVELAAGGVLIGAGYADTATDGMTWTNITEDVDSSWATENKNYTAASFASSAASTGRVVTLTNAGSSAIQTMAVGSFAPLRKTTSVPLAVMTALDSIATSDLTTYTFTNVDIGVAATDRVIMVAAYGGDVLSGTGYSSATIGGNAATLLSQTNTTASINTCQSIFYLAVPTGTTANIALSVTTSTNDRAFIYVYAIYGSTGVPLTSDAVNGNAVSTLTPSLTITQPCTVIGAATTGSPLIASWSSLSADENLSGFIVEGQPGSSARSVLKTSNFTETITLASAADASACLVAWAGV